MTNDVSECMEDPFVSTAKVHRLLCLELKKFCDKISQIITPIESARPGCHRGREALCKLHFSLEKASLLIQHCSESSKLYLAITTDKILWRCEEIRNSLELCLSQIQTMVPEKLAFQISRIVDDLRIATFAVESSEDEAGQVLLAFLRQDIASSTSANTEELKAIMLAALRLNITSPTAVLMEKRSLKNLLGKIQDTAPTKKRILSYFLYLVRKYWNSNGDQAFHLLVPTEEFKCPLSTRLMYDPVTIANGETFERLWIEKWFNEGHGTCPKTHIKLFDLSTTPNFALKDLISKWCIENGINGIDPSLLTSSSSCDLHILSSSSSIASLASSLKGLQLEVSNVSIRSSDTNNDLEYLDAIPEDGFGCNRPQMNEKESNDQGINLCFLTKLSSIPWESRRNAVEHVKNRLNENKVSHSMMSTSYLKPVLKFLKDARYMCDLGPLRDGVELLLILLRECRSEVPPLPKDTFGMLKSFLDLEITEEIFAIMEVLSTWEYYKSEIVGSGVLSSILRIIEGPDSNYHLPAMKALRSFSVQAEIGYHMIYLGYIPKLAPFLDNFILAGDCLRIFRNLCSTEEGAFEIVNTSDCIASVGELLELCAGEELLELYADELVVCVELLLSVCYKHEDFCKLVMEESILSCLFELSNRGNFKGKLIATELLQLLQNVKDRHSRECDTDSHPDIIEDSPRTPSSRPSPPPIRLWFPIENPRFIATPATPVPPTSETLPFLFLVFFTWFPLSPQHHPLLGLLLISNFLTISIGLSTYMTFPMN